MKVIPGLTWSERIALEVNWVLQTPDTKYGRYLRLKS